MLFDIETNALELEEITKLHTMTVYDYETDTFTRFDKEKVDEGVEFLAQADVVVGHNIINFDIPAIQKFFPWFQPANIIDTLVWTRLVYPDIKDIDMGLFKKGRIPGELIGRHSLEAWGHRLGEYKDDFGKTTDWQEWSQEMSDYCEQDVRVTKKLFEKLRQKGVSEEALKLEHDVAHIIKRQVDNGFPFDVEKAEALYVKLLSRREELEKELVDTFGSWYEPDGEPRVPKVNNRKLGIVKGAAYTKIKLVTFNPASRAHIAKRLQHLYGWEPKEFTPSGQPKVDESVLSELDYPEAKLLAEYMMIQKRIGQLAEGDKAWLKLVKNGRIHGEVITNGAVTGRMTHNNPNVAQVPAVSVPYGRECRELFKPRDGWVQVGCDASGLELRCLAHYMARYDDGAYAKVLLEGDIHTENQKAAGLPTRDNAKTFIYAFLYGAGNEKLGSIVGGGKNAGARLRRRFLNRLPALKKLTDQVKETAKRRGYLIGLDKRHLKVRSLHSALNTLLQSAGAIIMKKALVILDEDLQAKGFVPGKDYEFLANIHDEWQMECRPEIAEEVGKTAAEAIRKAGEYFKFRCPLDGEYKIGKNWAETH